MTNCRPVATDPTLHPELPQEVMPKFLITGSALGLTTQKIPTSKIGNENVLYHQCDIASMTYL